jgi:hypothetical protein
MQPIVDQAIQAYVRDRSEAVLKVLHVAFLDASLFVPLANPVREISPARYDIPVLCIRGDAGEGAIPAFTTHEHLLEWKPTGCLYTNLGGRALLEMAIGMTDISVILINPAGAPRGQIPREDFARMLTVA